jgi:NDP-sugar pyrophosphorylase family protein
MRSCERVDIPDLITRLIAAGHTVASYDHSGQWIDIGTPEDYARVEQLPRSMAATVGEDVTLPCVPS